MTNPEHNGTINENDLSPRTKIILQLIQALFPTIAAITAGLWGLHTYNNAQTELAAKAQAHLSNKKIELYANAMSTADKLVTLGPGTSDWQDNLHHFEQLTYLQLPSVQDTEVCKAMKAFMSEAYKAAKNATLDDDQKKTMFKASVGLIKAMKDDLSSNGSTPATPPDCSTPPAQSG